MQTTRQRGGAEARGSRIEGGRVEGPHVRDQENQNENLHKPLVGMTKLPDDPAQTTCGALTSASPPRSFFLYSATYRQRVPSLMYLAPASPALRRSCFTAESIFPSPAHVRDGDVKLLSKFGGAQLEAVASLSSSEFHHSTAVGAVLLHVYSCWRTLTQEFRHAQKINKKLETDTNELRVRWSVDGACRLGSRAWIV